MSDADRNFRFLKNLHEHRDRVAKYLNRFACQLIGRGDIHDNSKFGPQEFPLYANAIDDFEKYPFGSEGYLKVKESIASATAHHFKYNRHHPEHHANGFDDMDLVDLMEMICDWKAATLNHPEAPGDMRRSLEFAIKKYNISPQLAKILENTIKNHNL